MIKINNKCLGVLILMGGLLLAGQTGQAASAAKQLQKGIESYQKGDNDKALDFFIDVLMNGDSDQVSQANKYIDAIHNNIGGIKDPVEVAVSFPDQPMQTIVDRSDNLANYGQEKLDTLATSSEEIVKEMQNSLTNTPKTLTQQIEQRQLAGYTQDGLTPVTQAQSAILDNAAVLDEAAVNGATTVQDDLRAIAAEFEEETRAKQTQPLTTTTVPGPVEKSMLGPTTTVVSSSTFADLTSDDAIAARNLYTSQKLQSMTDAAIAALTAQKGVHLYLRNDGRPDALDIDDGVLFQGNAFRTEALPTLNNIYELLALTQGAKYIILPSGSYTDDVTLSGIREAMALKSYLVKRGISQGKLYYNMGLVDQEVPAQFTNLKGLSIVFDYDAKLPTQLLDNEDNETAPLLSMAIVPQCHAIDRSLGEAYAVDFSVLETVNTLDNWMLQVVQHGRDGEYYIVRQLEGFTPVYHQILWNGRKGIIGPELPCGKYTLVLTAVDLKGNKQTLRRRVIVKCAADAVAACQTGSCGKEKQMASEQVLNYKSARLWTKPGRVMRDVSAQQWDVAPAAVEEKASATQTDSSSYTVTKTVRNIVTQDNTPASTVTGADEYAPLVENAGGYAPATASPYDTPYEEEYTSYN